MGLRFMVFSLPHSGSTLPCLPDTAGLVAPPPPHGCCCWATAAAAWCCGCELPVSAGLLLAMLPRQEGGREEGGRPKLDRALRDNGPGPTPWKAVGPGSPLRCAPAERGTATGTPTHGPRARGGQQTQAARTPGAKESGEPGSTISSANCPWEQDGGPSGSDDVRPGGRAKPVANQSRPCGQAVPFPGCARSLLVGSAAAVPVPSWWVPPGSFAPGERD